MQHEIDERGEEGGHGHELHPALPVVERHARADERQDAQDLHGHMGRKHGICH
jgi:hypothetical protein